MENVQKCSLKSMEYSIVPCRTFQLVFVPDTAVIDTIAPEHGEKTMLKGQCHKILFLKNPCGPHLCTVKNGFAKVYVF